MGIVSYTNLTIRLETSSGLYRLMKFIIIIKLHDVNIKAKSLNQEM